jgi:hypothetical protein
MATFHVADLDTLQHITQQGQDDVLIASSTVSNTTTAVKQIQSLSLVWRLTFQGDFLMTFNRELGHDLDEIEQTEYMTWDEGQDVEATVRQSTRMQVPTLQCYCSPSV